MLVLMGGPDAEREVSLMSGRQVAQALRLSGRFHVEERIVDRPTVDDLRTADADVVFPVLHGPFGEGGPLQEILEALGVPYVGSTPTAAAHAMDKLETKRAVAASGVPVLPDCRLDVADPCTLEPPVVLKPIDDGSSVDLAICHTPLDITAARARLHGKRGAVMAERYAPGRELTVGVLGDDALPVIEVIPSTAVDFYDYEAKYFRDDTRYVIGADVPDELADTCRRHALAAFRRIGCRDVARVDFILDADDRIWFLEINTMPGFTSHSLVPMAAQATGLDMASLCAGLAERALLRGVAVHHG